MYKLLKPVRMSFLDHADRDSRLAAARRELELNRRIAPDVYLGLGDLHEHGELVDHVLIMRRMPAERRLSSLVATAGFAACVRAVAKTIASFHAARDPVRDAPMATAAAVRDLWSDNFATIEAHVPMVASATQFDRARELVSAFLHANTELFDRRIHDGFVVDGHGDLIADDIFCLDDGPRILDCLAFRDDFRVSDVLADIGFLVMDLHRLAGSETARRLMRWYQQFSYEHHPASLAHHYVAYRAHVRTKVACLTHEAGGEGQLELARTYHDLALHHLERAQLTLVLVGGAPGVGKSTVTEHLGDEFGATLLSSDEIRKDIAGLAHTDHAFADLEQGIYAPEMTTKAYKELLREADAVLRAGESAILDASWGRETHRVAARELAVQRGIRLLEIECHADVSVAKERIRARLAQDQVVSDATEHLAETLAVRRDPWPEAHPLSTAGPLDATLSRARELLERCLSSDPRTRG